MTRAPKPLQHDTGSNLEFLLMGVVVTVPIYLLMLWLEPDTPKTEYPPLECAMDYYSNGALKTIICKKEFPNADKCTRYDFTKSTAEKCWSRGE